MSHPMIDIGTLDTTAGDDAFAQAKWVQLMWDDLKARGLRS